MILLSTKKTVLNIIGFIIALGSVLFFNFVILGSMATKYSTTSEATIWGVAYLSGFILEYIIYSFLFCIFLLGVIKKCDKNERIKVFTLIYLVNP